MTESSDRPSQGSENPEATPQDAPPYPYPYPYPPPPPQPYSGYPPPLLAPKNGLGIAALVLAVVALLSGWIPLVGIVGIILGLVAVVIGFFAWGRVKRGTANNGGVAIAGIVLGALAVIVGLASFAIWMSLGLAFWRDVGGNDYIDCMQKAQSDRTKQQQCEKQFRENVQDRLSVTLTPSSAP